MKCKTRIKTHMRLRLEDLEGLNLQQQRRKLLERMVSLGAVQKSFWGKVKVGRKNECWNWHGATYADGYPMMVLSVKDRSYGFRGARISYFLHYGKFPDYLFVCHHCDNPLCVNPKHLFLGKQLQNMQDKVKKGRQAFGEKHGRCKLTVKQVQEIRRLHFSERVSRKVLAEKYQVGESTLWSLFIGNNWRWLPFPEGVKNPLLE